MYPDANPDGTEWGLIDPPQTPPTIDNSGQPILDFRLTLNPKSKIQNPMSDRYIFSHSRQKVRRLWGN